MSLTHLARARSAVLSVGLAAALVAASFTTSGSANAVTPPAGSLAGIMTETGGFTGDPVNAITTGWWGHEGTPASPSNTGGTVLSVDASDGAGTVTSTTLAAFLAKMGTTSLNKISYAIVPYSADGSTEAPTVTAGENAASAFANDCVAPPPADPCSVLSPNKGWLLDDSNPSTSINTTTNANDGLSALVSTRSQITKWVNAGEPVQTFDSNLQLVDITAPGSPSPTPKGTSLLNTWPAGTHLSLVAYVTNGADSTLNNKVPLVASTGGKAQTAWLNFTTVGKPADALRTSAGYVVDGAYAPTVSLHSSFSGTTATLTGTVKTNANTTATDATGNMEFAPVVGGVDQPPTTVAVTNGVASTQISVPAGTVKTYDVRYVPDGAASGTYLTSNYTRTTLIAPTPTSTTLTITGSTSHTFTAKVSPAVAGSFTFKNGSSVLGSATASGGSAHIVKSLTAGKHVIQAIFTPSSPLVYTGSSATKTVYQPTVTATLKPTHGRHGARPVVMVRVVASGTTPGGKVTIVFDPPKGPTKRFTVTLSHGVATFKLPRTVRGSTKVTAQYPGSGAVLAGNSKTVIFKAT